MARFRKTGFRKTWKRRGSKYAPRRRTKFVKFGRKKGFTYGKNQEIFGPHKYIKFHYGDKQLMNCTSGTYDVYNYRVNSLYDPDATGSGTQPRWYDTFVGNNNTTAPYYKYRVYACKADFQVFNLGTADLDMYLAAYPPTGTAPASIAEALERTKDTIVKHVSGTGGRNTARFTMYVDIAKLHGCMKSKVLEDDNFAGLYNANPAVNDLFALYALPTDISSTVPLAFNVCITYYARLENRNDVLSS